MTKGESYAALYDFVVVMKTKLDENEHKLDPGWRDMTPEWLYMRLQGEVGELYAELLAVEVDKDKVARECADVANFAMMIADRVKHERREEVGGADAFDTVPDSAGGGSEVDGPAEEAEGGSEVPPAPVRDRPAPRRKAARLRNKRGPAGKHQRGVRVGSSTVGSSDGEDRRQGPKAAKVRGKGGASKRKR